MYPSKHTPPQQQLARNAAGIAAPRPKPGQAESRGQHDRIPARAWTSDLAIPPVSVPQQQLSESVARVALQPGFAERALV